MMVTYVGSATNWKQKAANLETTNNSLQAEVASSTELYQTQLRKTAELKATLDRQILDLQETNNRLAADLKNQERLAQQYMAQADSWKGVMTGFEKSVANLQQSLNLTQKQLDTARSEGIKDQKELNEITASLYEKIVQLQALEADRRRLLEQKTELEKQVSSGAVMTAMPVTMINDEAQPMVAMSAGTNIQGLILAVEEGMVKLSVGTADGVNKDMKFHVTRGGNFVCDVIVTDVDINKSAGVLELIQQAPRIGDTASTEL